MQRWLLVLERYSISHLGNPTHGVLHLTATTVTLLCTPTTVSLAVHSLTEHTSPCVDEITQHAMQARRGGAELLHRAGDKPPSSDLERLSFWVVSHPNDYHGCLAAHWSSSQPWRVDLSLSLDLYLSPALHAIRSFPRLRAKLIPGLV